MDLQQPCWSLELERLDKIDPSSWVRVFDPSKKKKKKKKGKPLIHEDEVLLYKARHSDPDYGYQELLTRVFDLLREEDLEVSTDRPRTVLMSPRLLAQGTQTTTLCLNFADLCRTMHRKPGHVMKFVLGQMETKGFLDKQQRLEMQGLVSSQDFQAVFRRYIGAFVICSCCKSPDTALAEDNDGLFTLSCEMCGLVASIKEPNPL